MPRVHIQVQDAETFADLNSDDLWNEFSASFAQKPAQDATELRTNGVRRFGGLEAIDRKRAEKRKRSRRRSS